MSNVEVPPTLLRRIWTEAARLPTGRRSDGSYPRHGWYRLRGYWRAIVRVAGKCGYLSQEQRAAFVAEYEEKCG